MAESEDSPDAAPEITAFTVSAQALDLVPAPRQRQWMDDSPGRFAYRCLPLVIANQHGWDLLSPATFTARWRGGVAIDDIELQFDGEPSGYVSTHFGSGILTFSLGHLFRTSPGVNLWIKGPSNRPKDGASPLEGIIETDWSPYTFTMNWQLTRPGLAVRFERGEPVATLVPVERGYLARFMPRVRPVADDPALAAEFSAWSRSRQAFNTALADADPEAAKRGWQRSYMKGEDGNGTAFAEHETKLGLAPFTPPKP